MSSSSAKSEVAKLEADMAERAPVIEWRLDPVRRIQVACYVDDPYMDVGYKRPVLKQMEDEAYEVAERFRSHRADNTPLLAAARTEI